MPKHLLSIPMLGCLVFIPSVASAELLRDGGFDGDPPGIWEFRYLWKASTKGLPTWDVAVREGDPPQGAHLSIEGDARAAGTVLFGQKVTLPQAIGPLAVSFDYQTYCAADDRSGSADLRAYTLQAWAELPDKPQAGDGPEALFRQQLVGQGRDVTDWTHHESVVRVAQEALAPLAGQEIVLCLAWSTWHEGTEEWSRFDNISVRTVELFVEPVGWPRSCYGDRAIWLAADVLSSQAGPTVLLETRAPGAEAWRAAPMEPAGEDTTRYRARLDVAEPQPVECRVRARAGDREMTTDPTQITIKQRPPHPHVFYSPTDIEAMERRIERYDWAAAIFDGIRESADAWLERTDKPPWEGGGWSHDYSCQECGARLEFDPDTPHEHLCPTCNEYRTGEKLDRVWIGTIHGQFASAAANLGLTYAITGEEKYARRGAEILLDYARLYPTLPVNTGPAGRGRVMAQSLSECTWLLRVMQGYDLLYNALRDDERAEIEEFIRADTYDRFPYSFGIHNIQCWHNACYAAAGYLLGDDLLIDKSFNGKIGFYEQVRRGILDDGTWFERSIGYHYYTLGALVEHCEVARHNGLELQQDEKIKRMFLLPLRLAQPDLVPPSLSDQGYMSGRIRTDPLERALGWYGDREFAEVLAYLYATGAERTGRAALEYGEELPDNAPQPALGSSNLTGMGAAILRDGQGEDARWVLLRYGEHGGGHGHPDKLEVILYGLGQTLFPDLGNPGYGAALHRGYYKTTPGHNTVTLGQVSQRGTTGQCLAFHSEGAVQVAVAESRGAYEGALLRRTVVLAPGFLGDIYRVEAPEETTIDYVLRSFGELRLMPQGQPAEGKLGDDPGYRYMQLVERAAPDANGSWQAAWAVDEPAGARVHLTGIGADGCEILHVDAPGIAGRSHLGTLIIRRRGTHATFVVIHQLLKAGDGPLPVSPVESGVAVGDASDRVVILSPDLADLHGEKLGPAAPGLAVLPFRNGRVTDELRIDLP